MAGELRWRILRGHKAQGLGGSVSMPCNCNAGYGAESVKDSVHSFSDFGGYFDAAKKIGSCQEGIIHESVHKQITKADAIFYGCIAFVNDDL